VNNFNYGPFRRNSTKKQKHKKIEKRFMLLFDIGRTAIHCCSLLSMAFVQHEVVVT